MHMEYDHFSLLPLAKARTGSEKEWALRNKNESDMETGCKDIPTSFPGSSLATFFRKSQFSAKYVTDRVSNRAPSSPVVNIREFKQTRRRRQRERHLKM